MRRTAAIALAAWACWLSACAINYPQTAEEFRQAVPKSRFATVETFEVKRPLSAVAQTFRRRAAECLNVTVRTEERSSRSYQLIETEYRPTVVVGRERAELHVQRHYTKGVLTPGKTPKGGLYLLVADAFSLKGGRTRVQLYVPRIGNKPLIEAIRGWATGKNLGCPDLTKT